MEITDGTLSCVIMSAAGSATNYELVYGQWQAPTAKLKDAILGGSWPFDDVVEEFVLNLNDTTTDGVLSRLQTLIDLLTQANRFWRGDNVSPVLFKYQMKGSNLSGAQQALILKSLTDDVPVALPVLLDDAGVNFQILGARVRFLRRGALIGASEAIVGSAQNTGVVQTITFGSSHNIPSPIDVSLSHMSTVSSKTYKAFLIITPGANQLEKIDVGSGGSGHPATFTQVADTGSLADGNILRYTPTTTSRVLSGTYSQSTSPYRQRRLGFFATIRNNSTTRNYIVDVEASVANTGFGATKLTQTTRPVLVDTSTQDPRPMYLGSVFTQDFDSTNRRGFDSFGIGVRCLDTAGSGTLDIDTVVLVGLDSDFTYAPYISFVNYGVSSNLIKFNSNILTELQPEVLLQQGSGNQYPREISYDGNIALNQIKLSCDLMLLGTAGTYWRWVNNSNALFTITPTVTRYLAYQVPR